jgi:hypothetical protein
VKLGMDQNDWQRIRRMIWTFAEFPQNWRLAGTLPS